MKFGFMIGLKNNKLIIPQEGQMMMESFMQQQGIKNSNNVYACPLDWDSEMVVKFYRHLNDIYANYENTPLSLLDIIYNHPELFS